MNRFLRLLLFLGAEPVKKDELHEREDEALSCLSSYNGGDKKVLEKIHSDASDVAKKCNTGRRKIKGAIATSVVLLLLPFLTGCAAILRMAGLDAETAEQAGGLGEDIITDAATGNWLGVVTGSVLFVMLVAAGIKKKKGSKK